MAVDQYLIFGLEDASFMDAGAVPVYTDIPGVTKADVTKEVSEVKVPGDDDPEMDSWFWGSKATVQIECSVMDLDAFATVTGFTVTQEAGPPYKASIPLDGDTELNSPLFGLRLKQKAKRKSTGETGYLYTYLYNCRGTIKVQKGEIGQASTVTIDATAYRSDTDEYGNALTEASRGRYEFEED